MPPPAIFSRLLTVKRRGRQSWARIPKQRVFRWSKSGKKYPRSPPDCWRRDSCLSEVESRLESRDSRTSPVFRVEFRLRKVVSNPQLECRDDTRSSHEPRDLLGPKVRAPAWAATNASAFATSSSGPRAVMRDRKSTRLNSSHVSESRMP